MLEGNHIFMEDYCASHVAEGGFKQQPSLVLHACLLMVQPVNIIVNTNPLLEF